MDRINPSANGPTAIPKRNELNAFVDDDALISDVRNSSLGGLQKMIQDGSIRLFVPLYTLDRLTRYSTSAHQSGRDAQEALKWLDEVTSVSDRVYLQGGLEVYESWEEVEKEMRPETLLSLDSLSLSVDSIVDDVAEAKLSSSEHGSIGSLASLEKRADSPASPYSNYSRTSPAIQAASPPIQPAKVLAPIGTGRPGHSKNPSNVSAAPTIEETYEKDGKVPTSLRPFFNHLLWRIHHEQNAQVSIESFILVTNDALKQQIAKRFGIRAKRLDQVKRIVAKEEKGYTTRMASYRKENAVGGVLPVKVPVTVPEIEKASAVSDDEDEVVLKRIPPKSPRAMNGGKVLDPNAFSRRSDIRPTRPVSRQSNGVSPNFGGDNGTIKNSPRQRNGRPFSRGNPSRGNNGVVSNGLASPQSSAAQMKTVRSHTDLAQPIDPDSFARPSAGRRGGVRGGRGKLWEPS